MMLYYQKNYNENNLSAIAGQFIAISVLIYFWESFPEIPHYKFIFFALIISISIMRTCLIFFSKGKKYEKLLAITLIIATSLIWASGYFIQLLYANFYSLSFMLTYTVLTGASFAFSFALYKKPVLNITLLIITLLLPALLTLLFLKENTIPLTAFIFLSFAVNVLFIRVNFRNWKTFLAEKEKSDQYAEESKRLNSQLEEALKEAEKANAIKSDFIATVSHEIRTPLNGIVGMSTLIEETKLDAEQLEYVHLIQLSTNTLLSIINDILDFSKLESGKFSIESIPFDLRQIINELSILYKEKTKNKKLKFLLNIQEGLETKIIGDATRLRQILINLIGNAIKFTTKGYVKLTVKAEKIGPNFSMYHFQVEDTGIGIDEEKLETIFDRFTQADSSTTRKFGGTGLGLAITKELVRLMDGEIYVISKAGKGTTFNVNIPFKENINRDIEIPGSLVDYNDNNINENGCNLSILLVEDNEINQKIVVKMLQKNGYKVEVASNGLIALEMVLNYNYNLVLLDIQMPQMDGIKATHQIRLLDSEISRVPIIAMTANAMKGDREKYLSAGMDDYISKPIQKEQLLNKIKKWQKQSPKKTEDISGVI